MNWSKVAAAAPRPAAAAARERDGEVTPQGGESSSSSSSQPASSSSSAARSIDALARNLAAFPSLAASSSARSAAGAGLDNQGSAYNCFLNAVVQSLRLTAGFGEKLEAWRRREEEQEGDSSPSSPSSAVAEELALLCASLASASDKGDRKGGAASGHRRVVSPAGLRRALAHAAAASAAAGSAGSGSGNGDAGRAPSAAAAAFEEEAMADAGEALSALLDAVASSSLRGRALVDGQFGLALCEGVQCSCERGGCGSLHALRGGEPLPTQHIFLLPSAALRAAAEEEAAVASGEGQRTERTRTGERNALAAALAASLAQERTCSVCGASGARLVTSLFQGGGEGAGEVGEEGDGEGAPPSPPPPPPLPRQALSASV